MLKRLKTFGAFMLMVALSTGTALASHPAAAVDATQQSSACKGVVKDTSGEPIIGASVLVKGTTTGSVTDIDGNFSIPGVSAGATLVISYIGYNTQELKWNGTPLSVTLQDDSQTLNEVVVVGYGTQKKVNVTGAVSMVGAEAIESRPVANVNQALQGAVPGLDLTASGYGGILNGAMKINIRGTGSIGDGSVDSPLILIDGIEGDLNTVNPNDVESVSVLKDAAAASIYGSRAAFGVILVTTKSGKNGKVKINYSGDVRFASATQLPDMVNSLEWANYFNMANNNDGNGDVFEPQTIQNIKDYMAGKFTDPSDPRHYGTEVADDGRWKNYGSAFANTNWFDEHYKKNVASTQHNISLSGGTEKFNWMVSGSFLSQNGLIRHGKDQLKRYTFNSKIGAELASWIRMDYSTKWTRRDYTQPQYLSGLFFHNIARRWPSCPIRDPNGYYMAEMEIYELEDGGVEKTTDDQFTQQLKITITPLKGWNIYAEGALRVYNDKETENDIPIYNYRADGSPMLRDSGYGTVATVYDNRYHNNYYAINVWSDYTRSFGKHNAKVMLGVNFEQFDNDGLQGSGQKLTMESVPYLSQTVSNKRVSDIYWHRATAGYFGRLNYDYDGKYLLEVNLRYDGSSRFLADKRWAMFPSFSAGWRISEEKFMESTKSWLTNLKVRGSWGELGNTSSAYDTFWDWYPFYQQQTVGVANSAWLINGKQQNTAELPGLVNGNMTWETVRTWDLGLDFSLFSGRLTGTFDYFNRTTDDMIGPAPVLGSVLGTNAPKTNNTKMRTTGWELELGWRDHIGDFGYGVHFNLSDNTSKILEYPFDGEFENQSINGYYNGKEMGEIWGFKAEGLAQTQEQMDSWLAAGNKPNWGSGWQPGDVMFRDVNGDKEVSSGGGKLGDHGDLVKIGNNTPRFRMGLRLEAEYKGFDFSAFFQGVLKRDWMPGGGEVYFWGAGGGMWQSCVFREHLDYWSEDNPGAYYPRPYFNNGKNRQSCDRYMQSAAYMRCKNMQLGYTLPQSLTQKAGISNCRIYASVDNLFTITGLSGVYDPEVIENSWGWYGTGKSYPLMRTWSIGLSLSF